MFFLLSDCLQQIRYIAFNLEISKDTCFVKIIIILSETVLFNFIETKSEFILKNCLTTDYGVIQCN